MLHYVTFIEYKWKYLEIIFVNDYSPVTRLCMGITAKMGMDYLNHCQSMCIFLWLNVIKESFTLYLINKIL